MTGLHAFFPWLRYLLGFSKKSLSGETEISAFVKKVTHWDSLPYSFDYYQDYMEDLLADKSRIEVLDMGAGSKKMGAVREVSRIARYSVIKEPQAAMLCRLIYLLKPKRALELGTSLGASALCMAATSPESEIHTVDACPQTHAVAKYYLDPFVFENLHFHTQTFDEFLTKDRPAWDFVYMDGNHQYEPTVKMFDQLMPRMSEKGVILMDDIHWSKGMSKAWKEISRKEGLFAVDLFYVGMVFCKGN